MKKIASKALKSILGIIFAEKVCAVIFAFGALSILYYAVMEEPVQCAKTTAACLPFMFRAMFINSYDPQVEAARIKAKQKSNHKN
jgi:hypothetical protein